MGALFHFIKQSNPLVQHRMVDAEQKKAITAQLESMNTVLGIFDMNQCPLSPEINRLIQKREAARARKAWAEADAVREELLAMGINVLDTAGQDNYSCDILSANLAFHDNLLPLAEEVVLSVTGPGYGAMRPASRRSGDRIGERGHGASRPSRRDRREARLL